MAAGAIWDSDKPARSISMGKIMLRGILKSYIRATYISNSEPFNAFVMILGWFKVDFAR
jgi:hypothetical protein